MADNPTVECPKCGDQNEAYANTCANCGIDLEWALENWGQYVSGTKEMGAPLILITDDDPGLQVLIGKILERAGYRVAGVLPTDTVSYYGDGQQTLKVARRLLPDLIVTDIMKPTLDGISVISHLKADPILRDIPAIVHSARGDYESVSKALEAGALCYLFKPTRPPFLLEIVESVLAGHLLPLALVVQDQNARIVHRTDLEKAVYTGTLDTERLYEVFWAVLAEG